MEFLKKPLNFASSFYSHVTNGMRRVTPEEQEVRLSICSTCEYYSTRGIGPMCKDCGCVLSVKSSWSTENCPKGKWPILHIIDDIPSEKME